jgi:hypothetical protein
MEYYKKQLRHKTSTTTLTVLTIFAIVISLCILFQIGFITPAHALTHYFNCITRVANKNGTLTLATVEACYDKVFKGAN